MTTVLFVHGTGVRKDAFEISFTKIAAELSKRPNVSAKPCYWGHLGSELHAGGVSIPEYDTTRALGEDDGVLATSGEEYEVALWGILYEDPLYELRVLAVRQETTQQCITGQLQPGAVLAQRAESFEVPTALGQLLRDGGIDKQFDSARQSVTSSEPYRVALETASNGLAEYRAAIGRAFIAKAAALVEQGGFPARVTLDAQLRGAIERALIEVLGGEERSLRGWVKEQLGGLVLRVGTRQGVRRRGAITDAAHPATGDILLYQARGQQIQDFIRQQIVNAPKPRVLLAHSLGGIACVDLLVAEPLEVQLLVTVGSQAPFLYEINALQSLPFGQGLPAHFPRWLNIYDLRDFLSYKGEKVFPGKVRDVKVDNRQPFHWSHSAYWSNEQVWQAIAEELA
jgi:hypothetical protein